ncbi:MAG TPA: cytochrome c [Burkholderiales bacterium]|nr:cytochrome c [Burkholderiales bacterium]
MIRFSLSILFFASAALAQDPPPSGSAERGREAFLKYQCYTCHGTVGQGGERGAGPRLLPNLFPWVAFSMQTRTPRQDMPAYRKDHLGDQDLADIYAYLRSMKPSPAVANIPLLNFEEKR